MRVVDMDDGGMGSLHFVISTNEATRCRDHDIVTGTFKDLDGVDVFATLDVDKDGGLYELDVWKVDFTRLLSWPSPGKIVKANISNTSIN
jgi:hypothetical protein